MRHIDLWGNAPGNNPIDRSLCSIDPISSLALPLLLGAGGAAAASATSSNSSAPTPTAPPPQAPPQQKPQARQSQQQQSTFMGAIPTPPPSTGQKTLLGQ